VKIQVLAMIPNPICYFPSLLFSTADNPLALVSFSSSTFVFFTDSTSQFRAVVKTSLSLQQQSSSRFDANGIGGVGLLPNSFVIEIWQIDALQWKLCGVGDIRIGIILRSLFRDSKHSVAFQNRPNVRRSTMIKIAAI
jgi:hypothetical protein